MTDEEAARAALKAAGFSGPPLGSIYRRKARVVQEEMVVLYHGFVNLDVTADYRQIPALLAALDDKPATDSAAIRAWAEKTTDWLVSAGYVYHRWQVDVCDEMEEWALKLVERLPQSNSVAKVDPPAKQALDLCEQAIGLFLEFRDQHGWDEETAKPRALAEIREGLNAEPAIAEMEAAQQPCPECEDLGHLLDVDSAVLASPCHCHHGTGTADPPTDAQLLRTAALWMMHLSESYLPEGGDAAAQTAQMCADLRAMAARLEQDSPPPDTQPKPVLPKEG